MTDPDHPELICTYRLDGRGGGKSLESAAALAQGGGATAGDGVLWLHFDATHPETETWLRRESGLSAYVVDGLLAEETRPRCDSYDDGTLLILRGVNLNPGADPEDMVSLRVWIQKHRVISTRLRNLMAVQDIREQLAAGRGPISASHMAVRLAARMTDRMSPVIEDLSDQIAEREEQLIDSESGAQSDLRDVRHTLVQLRRVAISLRRYIAPQKDALNRLSQLDDPWLDDRAHGRLRETVDRVTRITEELDEVRERAAVVQDELASRLSQRMERTMYVLTVVATVMLPLGFLTGLLGVNVGGIPGSETGWAFWAFCGLLTVLVIVEIWVLRRLRWL